jgi:hypothetical protein
LRKWGSILVIFRARRFFSSTSIPSLSLSTKNTNASASSAPLTQTTQWSELEAELALAYRGKKQSLDHLRPTEQKSAWHSKQQQIWQLLLLHPSLDLPNLHIVPRHDSGGRD